MNHGISGVLLGVYFRQSHENQLAMQENCRSQKPELVDSQSHAPSFILLLFILEVFIFLMSFSSFFIASCSPLPFLLAAFTFWLLVSSSLFSCIFRLFICFCFFAEATKFLPGLRLSKQPHYVNMQFGKRELPQSESKCCFFVYSLSAK